MTNEALRKVLCHSLVVLNHGMHELGCDARPLLGFAVLLSARLGRTRSRAREAATLPRFSIDFLLGYSDGHIHDRRFLSHSSIPDFAGAVLLLGEASEGAIEAPFE